VTRSLWSEFCHGLHVNRGRRWTTRREGQTHVLKTLSSLKFLFTGPLILGLLFVINLMTSPGHWWVQWAALGIGIAWVISLLRVLRAVVVAGGLAALGAYLYKKHQ
jgi:hypothetical protein